jgi:hypothetical protein
MASNWSRRFQEQHREAPFRATSTRSLEVVRNLVHPRSSEKGLSDGGEAAC